MTVPENPPIITLTTDFGPGGPYAAAVKGVFRAHCPSAVVDELSHDIAPWDLTGAALFLEGALPWYPPGCIHVVVVDPGVGTGRRPVVVSAGGSLLVGPDNGIFSLLLRRIGFDGAWVIEQGPLFPEKISPTFHGRDLFAPAAAWLARGNPPESLGSGAGDLVQLEMPYPVVGAEGELSGKVVHVDRFGNCITNISSEVFTGGRVRVEARGGLLELPFCQTYGDAPRGTALALIGSGGRLEVAVREGNASAVLGIGGGTAVVVYPNP